MNNELFNYFYSLLDYSAIRHVAYFLSYPVAYSLPVILVLWCVLYSKRKLYASGLLFMTGISAWFVTHTLKSLFQYARPFTKLGFTPLYVEQSFSFPSTHSAIFFALATSMYLVNKGLANVLMVVAVLIGISRIILGLHYPVDVLGGFFVGGVIAFLYIQLFKKL